MGLFGQNQDPALFGFALFSQNQEPPRWLRFVLPKPGSTSLASLRSPKTRIDLVGFASFSQNEDLRSLASFPQKQDLPSVASFRDLPSGGFVPPKTRREGIWSGRL